MHSASPPRHAPFITSRIAIIAAALLAWASCGDGATTPSDPPPDPPAASAIVISPESATITTIGDTVRFTAALTDQYGAAFTGSITWSSTVPDVFSVTSDGLVTGLDNGSGAVTATFQSLSAEASVTVDANRAPYFRLDTAATLDVEVGETNTGSLQEYFDDPDGDALVFSAVSSDTSIVKVEIQGEEGTVYGAAEGSAVIEITATDPGGLEAMGELRVSVTQTNHPPQVLVDEVDTLMLAPGDTMTVNVSDWFIDQDLDSLSYMATTSDSSVAVAHARGASVEIEAMGEGMATATVTATDPDGLSAEVDVPIKVVAPPENQSPMAVGSIEDQSVSSGDTMSLDLSGYFSDPDGDALIYAASSSDGGVATAEVDGEELVLAGAGPGEATISVSATDPGGLFAEQTFTVSVPNSAPQLVLEIADTVLAYEADTLVVRDLSAYFQDPDGEDLVFEVETDLDWDYAVEGSELVIRHGRDIATLSDTVAESGAFTVSAFDGAGLQVVDTFEATVEEWVPLAAVEVAPGVVTITLPSLSFPVVSCFPVDNYVVNDLRLTAHFTEWQTRADSASDWMAVAGTRVEKQVCPYPPLGVTPDPGEYRVVGELEGLGGPVRRKYRSINTFTVPAGYPGR